MGISAKLDEIADLLGGNGDEEAESFRERMRRTREENEAARRNMQQILDRVEARMQERQARRDRSPLRRLLSS